MGIHRPQPRLFPLCARPVGQAHRVRYEERRRWIPAFAGMVRRDGRSVRLLDGLRLRARSTPRWQGVVRPEGFEPPTLGSEDRCSCPLSYGRTPARASRHSFDYRTFRRRAPTARPGAGVCYTLRGQAARGRHSTYGAMRRTAGPCSQQISTTKEKPWLSRRFAWESSVPT